MVSKHLSKACFALAILILLALPTQAQSSNPENAGDSEPADDELPPCSFLIIDTEAPYVDPHVECIGSDNWQPLLLR